MILQAISTHVGLNAEELRAKWVQHEGKKDLTVKANDFVYQKKNDWASVIEGRPDSFKM